MLVCSDHQSYVTSCVIRSQVVSFVCFDVARLIVTSKSFDTSASDTPRHDFSQPCIAKLNCVALRHRKPLPSFINSWYIRYCISGLASQHIRVSSLDDCFIIFSSFVFLLLILYSVV